MKMYTVNITDKALADMEDIYNYIADILMSSEYAIGQYTRISEAVESLKIFPERVKIMESDPEREMELRQLQVDNYSVFYVIQGENVIVVRVLYSASDIGKRLLEE